MGKGFHYSLVLLGGTACIGELLLVCLQSGQVRVLQLRAKRGNGLIRIDGKEEIVFGLQHRGDHCLYDGITGSHQAVLNSVAIKFKGKMKHLTSFKPGFEVQRNEKDT